MIKSLVSANKSEREKFTVPRSVQATIPVKCVYPDGIWLVGITAETLAVTVAAFFFWAKRDQFHYIA